MKKQFLKLSWFLFVIIIDFYLLPILIKDTGSAILMLLIVIPMIAFLSNLIYGIFSGKAFLLPLIATLLFVPTVFIYYNSSAWVYIVIYGVVMYIGNGIGFLINKLTFKK